MNREKKVAAAKNSEQVIKQKKPNSCAFFFRVSFAPRLGPFLTTNIFCQGFISDSLAIQTEKNTCAIYYIAKWFSA